MKDISMLFKLKGQPPLEYEDITRFMGIVFYRDEKNVVQSSLLNVNMDHNMVTSIGNYMLRVAKAMEAGQPIPKMYDDLNAPKNLGNRIIAPQNGLILPG